MAVTQVPLHTHRSQEFDSVFCFLPGPTSANTTCYCAGPLHLSPCFNKWHRFDFLPLLQKHTRFGLMTEEIVLPGCKKVRDNCMAHIVKMKALSALSGAPLLWSAKCWKLSPYPAKCFKAAGSRGVFGTESWKVKLIHGNVIHVHCTYSLKWKLITFFFIIVYHMHPNKPGVKWGSWQLDGSMQIRLKMHPI